MPPVRCMCHCKKGQSRQSKVPLTQVKKDHLQPEGKRDGAMILFEGGVQCGMTGGRFLRLVWLKTA